MCFRCNQWIPGHKCCSPKLLIVEEVYEQENGGMLPTNMGDLIDWENSANTGPKAEISLHAMIGSPNLRTMRVRAKVGNLTIIAFIDIGSTHSFVPLKMAKRTRIEISAQRFMGVKVTDSTKINSEGKCVGFKFKIQRNHFVS